MAHVDYIMPVEALHGKLKKTDRVGFAKRQVEGTKYTFTLEKRKYKPTAEQSAQTKKFGMVCQLTNARLRNASTRATDVANFHKQSRYKTFHSYIWHDIWNNYDQLLVDGELGEEMTN